MIPTDYDMDLDWLEGDVPYSRHYGDTYFTRTDGRGETRHVFLAGNGLPDRWRSQPAFTLVELGFGTGLNFLETWWQWRLAKPAGGHLHYCAFECHPLTMAAMARAVARWPDLTPLLGALAAHWPPDNQAATLRLEDSVALTLFLGDANETLPLWHGAADAWFLDGFAPAKNPDLWNAGLMRTVFEKSCPGATLATYSVAGAVKRNLIAAGFAIETAPGFASKREMLKARKPG